MVLERLTGFFFFSALVNTEADGLKKTAVVWVSESEAARAY